VVNFFKPASQKEPEKVTWATRGNSLVVAKYRSTSKDIKPLVDGAKRRIAAFDFVRYFPRY
jgi:bifunctional polynucleotide phosphatase/kinase